MNRLNLAAEFAPKNTIADIRGGNLTFEFVSAPIRGAEGGAPLFSPLNSHYFA